MKKLKIKLIIALFLLIGKDSFSQNLVPNPSFEVVACQTAFNFPFGCTITNNSPWVQPSQGSSDSFNTCHTGAFGDYSVPANFQGTQAAHTGDGYGGIMTYEGMGIVYREYIQIQLTTPLVAGNSYSVSFYCSLGDNSQYASSGLGAYISVGAISSTNQNNLPYTAHIEAASPITNSSGWELISGTFTASGGEDYITIGNFNDDINTTTSLVSAGAQFNRAFYFIDDVNVSLPSGSGLSICEGDSILIGGVFQNTNGIYPDTLIDSNGMDSIINIPLNVILPYISPFQVQSICEGDSLLIGSIYYSTSDFYYDSLQTEVGCDSLINIYLEILPSYNDVEEEVNICEGDSVLISGIYYNTGGMYTDSLQSLAGCDSVVQINLNINPVFDINQSQTICDGDSLLVGEIYYNSAGTFTDSLQTTSGCDSIITTVLSMTALPNVSLSDFNPDTLCENAGAVLLPIGSPSGGTYFGSGVSGSNFVPSISGLGTHDIIYTYTNNSNCSNNDTTQIVILGCAGVSELANDFDIIIYPNPVNNKLFIDLGTVKQDVQIEIFGLDGKLVFTSKYHATKLVDINLDLSNGAYSLLIKMDGKIATKKIIKI